MTATIQPYIVRVRLERIVHFAILQAYTAADALVQWQVAHGGRMSRKTPDSIVPITITAAFQRALQTNKASVMRCFDGDDRILPDADLSWTETIP